MSGFRPAPGWALWLALVLVIAAIQQARVMTAHAEIASVRTQLAEQARLHQAALTAISEAAALQARQALDQQQRSAQALQDIDLKLTQEKTHALAENDRLRRAVADGARRLRVAGSCAQPAVPTDMPSTDGTASLDSAGTVELAATAGRNLLDIRSGIIADQAALRSLQQYVTQVCLGGTSAIFR